MTTKSKTKYSNSPDLGACSELAIRSNMILLEHCKTSMSALSGFTAGVIGLYGINGFIFYFICCLVLWAMILVKIGSDHEKFFPKRSTILTNGIGGGLFTYVLFWTFLYGMVHVY